MYRFKKKDKSIKCHFFNRCIERLGVMLNTKEIINKIQSNELKCFKKNSLNRTVFLYPHAGKEYKVVYDRKRHDVVTIF